VHFVLQGRAGQLLLWPLIDQAYWEKLHQPLTRGNYTFGKGRAPPAENGIANCDDHHPHVAGTLAAGARGRNACYHAREPAELPRSVSRAPSRLTKVQYLAESRRVILRELDTGGRASVSFRGRRNDEDSIRWRSRIPDRRHSRSYGRRRPPQRASRAHHPLAARRRLIHCRGCRHLHQMLSRTSFLQTRSTRP
jgi:hypothetical protein